MSIPRYLLTGLLLTLLAACAPITERQAERPVVALINAPAEQRVSLVADALEERVRNTPGCCTFSFVRSQPVRFQETHRDMFGSRAAPQAASLARNLGAQLAVMAGAPRFERTVEELDGRRRVEGEVQLRAIVIDAASGERLATVASFTFRGERLIDLDEELPELDEDPTMVALVRDAADDLAPHLAAVLADLANDYPSGSSS